MAADNVATVNIFKGDWGADSQVSYIGYYNGRRWNGRKWAVPEFEKDVADAIMADVNKGCDLRDRMWYDRECDCYRLGDEPGGFFGREIATEFGPVHCYSIGGRGWCWVSEWC